MSRFTVHSFPINDFTLCIMKYLVTSMINRDVRCSFLTKMDGLTCFPTFDQSLESQIIFHLLTASVLKHMFLVLWVYWYGPSLFRSVGYEHVLYSLITEVMIIN